MVGPCFVVHYLVSSFAIIWLVKKESRLLYFDCLLMAFDSVLCFFLTVLWVGLLCVIVAFLIHTHLLFLCDLLSSILKFPTVNTISTALL